MIKMRSTLEEAINEIDTIEEYYKEQYSTMIVNIKKEMEKYKYGLAIYKYLCGRVHSESKPKCMNQYEEKFIQEELIIMEDENDNKKVQYKLKNPEKYSKEYELDPIIAERKTSSLITQKEILNESVIIMLIIRYESIISQIYKKLLIAFPNAYLKDKSITYSELISFKSNIADIKKAFVENEVDEFMRKTLKEWYTTFEQKHKIYFEFSDEFEQFREIYYRRNIVVHNQSKVNNTYLNAVSSDFACELGKKLIPTKTYLLESLDCTRIILIQTVLGLLKITSDRTAVIDELFDVGFRYMTEEKWRVSKYIFNALMNLDGQSDAELWCNKVNYFVSCKNSDGVDSIRDLVEKIDTSAMAPRLAVAKPALLDNFAEVTEILDDIIEKDISVSAIKSWPLYIQYRETSEYMELVERHKDLFEIETCTKDEITCLSDHKTENSV